MGRHRYGGRERDVRTSPYGDITGVASPAPVSGRLRPPLAWGLVVAALAIWSLLAWGAYGLADGLIGWSSANAGAVVEGGKGVATAAGIGKPVGDIVDTLNLGGLAGQGLDLIRALLGPAVIAVWVVGAALLLAAPWLLSRFGGLLAGWSRRG